MTDTYIAAVRGTAGAGPYEGCVVWDKWPDKQALDAFIESMAGGVEIVEEGITEARAEELEFSTERQRNIAIVRTIVTLKPLYDYD